MRQLYSFSLPKTRVPERFDDLLVIETLSLILLLSHSAISNTTLTES